MVVEFSGGTSSGKCLDSRMVLKDEEYASDKLPQLQEFVFPKRLHLAWP